MTYRYIGGASERGLLPDSVQKAGDLMSLATDHAERMRRTHLFVVGSKQIHLV